MARGRKITLYLIDGLPSGIIKAQIGNWVGLVGYIAREWWIIPANKT